MPRIVILCLSGVLLVGACSFHADYSGGHYTCSDGLCPSGLVCNARKLCINPALIDAGFDAMPDAKPHALTCADPGLFPAAGGSASGTTTLAHGSTVSSTCGGFVMNGPDAIYKVTTLAGKHLLVEMTGQRKAYVLPACVTSGTPACLQNTFATSTSPLAIPSTTAGDQWIIVDDENAAATGPYTVTVTVN